MHGVNACLHVQHMARQQQHLIAAALLQHDSCSATVMLSPNVGLQLRWSRRLQAVLSVGMFVLLACAYCAKSSHYAK
jgi:hypothetical protein